MGFTIHLSTGRNKVIVLEDKADVAAAKDGKLLVVLLCQFFALDGVNFSVEDGEFVAVVGTYGSGKSTLLHMMRGLDTPTSGTVIVRGEELAKKNDEQLTIFRRRNIGFIFRTITLFLF